LGRALTRRCPYCGGGGIYKGYLELRDSCPTCGVQFEREEGYFLGAYALNLVVSEILALGLAMFLIFRTGFSEADLTWQLAVAVALTIAFPLLFFPYSRTLWIAMDLTFHPPGPAKDRELRRHHLSRLNEE
jgi:uncharacterized protein (DUF983 family)